MPRYCWQGFNGCSSEEDGVTKQDFLCDAIWMLFSIKESGLQDYGDCHAGENTNGSLLHVIVFPEKQ